MTPKTKNRKYQRKIRIINTANAIVATTNTYYDQTCTLNPSDCAEWANLIQGFNEFKVVKAQIKIIPSLRTDGVYRGVHTLVQVSETTTDPDSTSLQAHIEKFAANSNFQIKRLDERITMDLLLDNNEKEWRDISEVDTVAKCLWAHQSYGLISTSVIGMILYQFDILLS